MRKAVTILFLSLFCSTALLQAQITVDGDLSESAYKTIGTKQNSNAGFGSSIDVSRIVYYADNTNNALYIGVVGKLNTANDDGIGIWLNITSQTGAAAGTVLGIAGGGHYIDGDNGTNLNYKADFEVDYQFAFNPGNGTTNVYFDAAENIGTASTQYFGQTDQSGTSATAPSADGIFTANSITWAFNNGGGTNTGVEIRIPYSELGASSSDFIEVFAFVVSSTAWFSDVTVPGNVTTGNPGQNVDFGALSGGPYHTTLADGSLPVELVSFSAEAGNEKVTLTWQTASELNNQGFVLLRSTQKEGPFEEIDSYEYNAQLRGAGTTSNTTDYAYTDRYLVNGTTYWYKLVDVDVNGRRTGSGMVSATPQADNLEIITDRFPARFRLEQNYPNPFNPSTRIGFDIAGKSGDAIAVNLSVYNTQGVKIKTLYNGLLAPGEYTLEWDGINESGQIMSSGVYFYRLSTPRFTTSKKMILMR